VRESLSSPSEYLLEVGNVGFMPSSSQTRVLAIGMFDSVHFSGWLRHFQDEDIQFLLFPSSPHRRLTSGLQQLLENEGRGEFKLARGTKYLGLPMWILDKALSNRLRAAFVKFLISRFKPDFAHALELQNAGYLALRAYEGLTKKRPILIATNYGSDIYWFSRDPKHLKLISELLQKVDRYAAECGRDVELARQLGFSNDVMPVLPNAGGFTLSQLGGELMPGDKRKLIMVKGYHGWVGRAHIALHALESISAELQDFEVVVYSCNLSTKRLAAQVAKRTGLRVTAYSKGALSHDEMVENFSRSLIYVGLSLSDGISTSMLEAMAMGAIPVQTSTACCNEWFSDTGVAIETLAAEEVAQGIRRAIWLALTTESAAKNRETVRVRASREAIAKQALAFYQL
jgi:glycosyltransferase involved in cell wall biosynthesis